MPQNDQILGVTLAFEAVWKMKEMTHECIPWRTSTLAGPSLSFSNETQGTELWGGSMMLGQSTHYPLRKGEGMSRIRAREAPWSSFGHICIFVLILIIIMLSDKLKKKKRKNAHNFTTQKSSPNPFLHVCIQTCFDYKIEIMLSIWDFVLYLNWSVIHIKVECIGVKCTFWWVLTNVYLSCPSYSLSSHIPRLEHFHHSRKFPSFQISFYPLHLLSTLLGKHCSDFYHYRWVSPVLELHKMQAYTYKEFCILFFFFKHMWTISTSIILIRIITFNGKVTLLFMNSLHHIYLFNQFLLMDILIF